MIASFKARKLHLLSAGAFATVVFAGCSTVPPPTANLMAARQAITNAESAEAPRYAAAELASSRSKLLEANSAVTAKNMVTADRFAEESRVEAEFATAKALSAKATLVNDEMRTSTSALVEEMNRKSGDKR